MSGAEALETLRLAARRRERVIRRDVASLTCCSVWPAELWSITGRFEVFVVLEGWCDEPIVKTGPQYLGIFDSLTC